MGTDLLDLINRRYLSGIADEPKQLLHPIQGYALEPLLPLEDACQPIVTIVPNLPSHIWIAKENCKQPSDGLTQDESAAIHLYTMEWDANVHDTRESLYSHLNRTLKQKDRTKLRPWFRYLKLFLTALAKIPPMPRQTIWRGVRKDFTQDYPKDSQVIWWGFSSCTKSLDVLESQLYLGHTDTRTLFSIETFNARSIRAHSHFKTEDEILLLPGTYLEVKSQLKSSADLNIIHLKQIKPPHQLLEPPFPGADLLAKVDSQLDMVCRSVNFSNNVNVLSFLEEPIKSSQNRRNHQSRSV
jgi:hypothetical protein